MEEEREEEEELCKGHRHDLCVCIIDTIINPIISSISIMTVGRRRQTGPPASDY